MTTKEFKKLVDSEYEAKQLIEQFDTINVSSSYRKTPNGRYIVTFWI